MTVPRDAVRRGFGERFSLPEIHWGWLLLIAGVLALLIAASGVLGPFLAGFAIAYLLDPLALRLQRLGFPRALAAALVLGGALALLGALVWAAAPIVQEQMTQLATALPGLLHDWQPLVARWLRQAGAVTSQKALMKDFSQRMVDYASNSVGDVIAGGLAVFNIVALVVIAPIVAFYFLRDWGSIKRKIASWWPPRHAETIRGLVAEADVALSGFVRGQFLVCCGLAVLYAIAWGFLGLNYAFTLALLAGVLGFVPYLGPAFILALSLTIAVGQFGTDALRLGSVAGVFAIVQTIEATILTPNLIGNRIGLHPVWVLFAILAGGAVAGVVGVFLAVPVAAVAGVFARWAMRRYLASDFYRAGDPPA